MDTKYFRKKRIFTFIVVEYTERTSNVSYRLDGEFSEKSSQKNKNAKLPAKSYSGVEEKVRNHRLCPSATDYVPLIPKVVWRKSRTK